MKGQDLLLKEGSKVVKRIAITGKELTVQDVPNGVYTIGNFQLEEKQDDQVQICV
ncbi:hypothetical protein P7H20_23930 [Paenibacillus larvae]|nr:hypothetical protein [Paenibacillus larvae]MDT2277285.1 hypothetical protein [Paenibacillus larvae]